MENIRAVPIGEEIVERLFALRDEAYRDFQSKLIPTVDKADMIGVRTPALRAYAGEIAQREDREGFLAALPHRYYDEYLLHALTVSLEKDFSRCLAEAERLLPYIDNWAVCDQLCPKSFQKHRQALLPTNRQWLDSRRVYTVRFAVKMLMTHFLDDDFDPAYLEAVANLRSEEYYINMMRAWYFATALAKQYEATLPYLEQRRLDSWTHNKTIQKAAESYRIPSAIKPYLKSLKEHRANNANQRRNS